MEQLEESDDNDAGDEQAERQSDNLLEGARRRS